MLDEIYTAIENEVGENHEVKYLSGGLNSMIITIDGEQYFIQKR